MPEQSKFQVKPLNWKQSCHYDYRKKRRKKVTEKGSGHSRNYSIFLAKLTFRKRNLYFNGDNAVTTNLL